MEKGNDVNSITISYTKEKNQFTILSKHLFFLNEYIKVKVIEGKVIFSIPTLDYKGKMYKTFKNNKSDKWHGVKVVNDLLVKGKFEINKEESTEDELIVYLKLNQ